MLYNQDGSHKRDLSAGVLFGKNVGRDDSCLPHVPLELAQFDRRVVTLRTLVRLLQGVTVAHVAHQLAGRREGHVAELALVRLGT